MKPRNKYFSEHFVIAFAMIVGLILVLIIGGGGNNLEQMSKQELRQFTALIAVILSIGIIPLVAWLIMRQRCKLNRRPRVPNIPVPPCPPARKRKEQEPVYCEDCGKNLSVMDRTVMIEDPKRPGVYLPHCPRCYFRQKRDAALGKIEPRENTK